MIPTNVFSSINTVSSRWSYIQVWVEPTNTCHPHISCKPYVALCMSNVLRTSNILMHIPEIIIIAPRGLIIKYHYSPWIRNYNEIMAIAFKIISGGHENVWNPQPFIIKFRGHPAPHNQIMRNPPSPIIEFSNLSPPPHSPVIILGVSLDPT